MILTVAQRKGGAGKTTLVVQLATGLVAAGRRVAVVDIDPQASLTAWMRARETLGPDVPELRFSMIGGWRLGAELGRLAGEVDDVIVDTPPHAESDAKVAIREAGLVLVPCQPSAADYWASRATMEMAAREARSARFVLNRVPPRGKAIDEAVAAIEAEGWPLLKARLGNRQIFAGSFGRGLGVVEAEPRGQAAREVQALVSELLPAL